MSLNWSEINLKCQLWSKDVPQIIKKDNQNTLLQKRILGQFNGYIEKLFDPKSFHGIFLENVIFFLWHPRAQVAQLLSSIIIYHTMSALGCPRKKSFFKKKVPWKDIGSKIFSMYPLNGPRNHWQNITVIFVPQNTLLEHFKEISTNVGNLRTTYINQ